MYKDNINPDYMVRQKIDQTIEKSKTTKTNTQRPVWLGFFEGEWTEGERIF